MRVKILENTNIAGMHYDKDATPDLSEKDAKTLMNPNRPGGPLAEKYVEPKAAPKPKAKDK